jgi:hypothetical protein
VILLYCLLLFLRSLITSVTGHIRAESIETNIALRKTRKDVTIPKPAPGPTYADADAAVSRSTTMMKRGSRRLPVSRFFTVILVLP